MGELADGLVVELVLLAPGVVEQRRCRVRRDQLEHASASTSIERLSASAKYRRDAGSRLLVSQSFSARTWWQGGWKERRVCSEQVGVICVCETAQMSACA